MQITDKDNRQVQAYDAIRSRILAGEIAPMALLSETQLAAQLALSRTPVREALKRLEHDGLVRSYPNRGTFVTEVTVQDILEIYQVREQLEGFAARIAAEQMTPEEIGALEAVLARGQAFVGAEHAAAASQHDIAFHQRIIAATRNGRLQAILKTVDDQMYRIRVMSSRSSPWVVQTLAHHADILAAISARQPQRAEHAMREHLRRARENAIRLVTPRMGN